MENALHFLDELKDKCMHQAQQAIDDWDYQDFPPDMRSALLDEEVKDQLGAGLSPANASLPKKPSSWEGLSREAELENADYGASLSASAALGFEEKAVRLVTPSGGIQGLPDPEPTKRFLDKAVGLDAKRTTAALSERLEDSCWQVRSKALVIMQLLIESKQLGTKFLRVFADHTALMQRIDTLRRQDHNPIARENARKLLSLIQSNGTNPLLIDKEHVAAKPHVRHAKKNPPRGDSTGAIMKGSRTPASLHVTTAPKGKDKPAMRPSPKVAEAALASWKRRSFRDTHSGPDSPNLMPYQRPTISSSSFSFECSEPSASLSSSGPSDANGSTSTSGFDFFDESPAPAAAPMRLGGIIYH